jgi:hypothetical protein
MKNIFLLLMLFTILISCENRDINEGEEFKPRELNEDFGEFHFNRIVYDGVEYLITERDNNNPHEGFGFMAMKGNTLLAEQDSIMAHVRAIGDMQIRIYAKVFGISNQESDSLYQAMFSYYLFIEQSEVLEPVEEDTEETVEE